MKHWLGLTFKLALSVFLIWFLLDNIDIESATAKLTEVSLPLVFLSCLVIAFQLVLATFRWQAVLRAIHAPLKFLKSFQIVYIGAFFNQALPSSVGGDAVRIYTAYKSGLTLSSSINGIVLERVASVLGLVLLVLIYQPFLFDRFDDAIPLWLFPSLMAAGLMGVAFMMVFNDLPAQLQRWRVLRFMAYLSADTRLVFLQPTHTLKVMALTVIGHINVSFSVWILGLSLGLGDQLGLFDCLILIPPVLLVTVLPISIAGWGVREGAMVTALGLIGVSAESALVLSILFGLAAIAASLPGGLIWLLSGLGRRLKATEELTVSP